MANFNNIKCIDLTVYTYDKLNEIGTGLKLAKPSLLGENKKIGIGKIWFDIDNSNAVIAYTVKGSEEILIADNFFDSLKSIKPVTFVVQDKPKPVVENKVEVEDIKIELDIDTILDKIGQYGIDSITKEEKKFLDNNY
jgi:hypothetical protein